LDTDATVVIYVLADRSLRPRPTNIARRGLADARGPRLDANLVDDANDAGDALRAVDTQLLVVIRGDSSAQCDDATICRDVDLMGTRHLPADKKIQHAPFQVSVSCDHHRLGIADVGRFQGRSIF
jgi:fermentation-respiration switch protein FrsA (DUF1100 family)